MYRKIFYCVQCTAKRINPRTTVLKKKIELNYCNKNSTVILCYAQTNIAIYDSVEDLPPVLTPIRVLIKNVQYNVAIEVAIISFRMDICWNLRAF